MSRVIKKTNVIAGVLLLFVFLISFFSILGSTLTYDETAHITAGYSYLTKRDMRVNPEHPPLIKDLAAAPLLLLNLNFPDDSPNWLQEHPPRWWVQFDLANEFLYKSGNDPDKIMLFSRLSMIAFLVLLGFLIFYITKKRYGDKAALISLFLFSFSPTFLAHGRLANTDVGAAFGALLSIYFWVKFLEHPSKKNTFLAGITFGIALLLKFSLVLLIPVFIITTLTVAIIKKKLLKYLFLAFLAGVVGMVFVVFPVYQYHVYDYPPERQARDAEFLLETFGNRTIADSVVYASDKPIMRPFAQYFLGLFTAMQRTDGGNTTYFMGEVSTTAWKSYFPVVYFIKETLTFHILTLITLLMLVFTIFKQKKFEFTMLTFIIVYWGVSINSNLNIGVRHLLPVFPLTFIIIGGNISKLISIRPFKYILFLLLAFQAYSVITAYPHFLAYFNETVENGHEYVVDSNLDWGQDLKRLEKWIDKNNIDFIYIDYFGGGNLDYYIGENRHAKWNKHNPPQEFPKGNYLAVSVNQLQGGRGTPVKGFDQEANFYMWLNDYEPVHIAGRSIFIYYIE